MSLLGDIDAASTRPGPGCAVSLVLAELDPEDRADLVAAIGNVRYTGTTIAKVLTAHGHRIGDTSINRHRRGACQCSPTS